MVFAYLRISTDQQTVENQKFEILNFADQKNINIEKWIEEIISGTIKYDKLVKSLILTHSQNSDSIISSSYVDQKYSF